MNKFIKLLLVIIGCFTLQTIHAQNVDAIIAKYINALGGKAKLKALRSVKITGTLRGQGFDVKITTTILNGVGTRTDIAVPDAGEGYQIVTRTKGWMFMPFTGQTEPQELTAGQVQAGQISIDLQGALLDYKQKGHQVELVGKEMVDSVECYKIKLTDKIGKEFFYFIDTKNYYRIKMLTTEVVNGTPTEIATVYSDFKRTPEGYLFPYAQNNINGIIKVMMISINKPVAASVFEVKK